MLISPDQTHFIAVLGDMRYFGVNKINGVGTFHFLLFQDDRTFFPGG